MSLETLLDKFPMTNNFRIFHAFPCDGSGDVMVGDEHSEWITIAWLQLGILIVVLIKGNSWVLIVLELYM